MEHPAGDLALEEARARLALSIADGVGAVRFGRLLAVFGSATAALRASRKQLTAVVGDRTALSILAPGMQNAVEKLLGRLNELAAEAVVFGQSSYPVRLAGSPDPPPVLYVAGRLDVARAAAIVGCRAASRRFLDLTRKMAADLASAGFTVVSGGAYGIDAAAHLGALDAGGPTVCVLGGGLDQLYPDRHVPLFEDIARAGALLSPFRPGTAPRRGCFLSRNRVIAALSEAVVVVEAGGRSGARSTALQARTLGRKVMAVRGSPGTARLIAEGAAAVASGGEVFRIIETGDHCAAGGNDGETRSAEDADLSPDEAAVLAGLRLNCVELPDNLAKKCGLPVHRVLAALTGLELAGQVLGVPGGRFQRI